MSASSRSPASYLDVHRAFEAAGSLGSITLSFATRQAATIWNMRANKYRVLLRQRSEAEGGEHISPFDHLMIKKPEDDPCIRTIEHRGYNFEAFGPDGKPLDLDKRSLSGPVSVMKEPPLPTDFNDFLESFERDIQDNTEMMEGEEE